MANRFEGKVVIVTGGTRGMGEAIVRGLVAEGGYVVFGGRDTTAGKAIEAELGATARYVQHDVGSEAEWESVAAAALDFTGRIDGLVNNAGAVENNPVAETSLDMLARLAATNQNSVLLGIKHVVGPMRAEKSGSIVNIGSIAVRRGMAGISAYSGAKAAVAGITRAAAVELGPDGIRVNTIHPGPFATRMMRENAEPEVLAAVLAAMPLRRMGEPKEIVGPVLFLLSDESSYVTGAELSVDGGGAL